MTAVYVLAGGENPLLGRCNCFDRPLCHPYVRSIDVGCAIRNSPVASSRARAALSELEAKSHIPFDRAAV